MLLIRWASFPFRNLKNCDFLFNRERQFTNMAELITLYDTEFICFYESTVVILPTIRGAFYLLQQSY